MAYVIRKVLLSLDSRFASQVGHNADSPSIQLDLQAQRHFTLSMKSSVWLRYYGTGDLSMASTKAATNATETARVHNPPRIGGLSTALTKPSVPRPANRTSSTPTCAAVGVVAVRAGWRRS